MILNLPLDAIIVDSGSNSSSRLAQLSTQSTIISDSVGNFMNTYC